MKRSERELQLEATLPNGPELRRERLKAKYELPDDSSAYEIEEARWAAGDMSEEESEKHLVRRNNRAIKLEQERMVAMNALVPTEELRRSKPSSPGLPAKSLPLTDKYLMGRITFLTRDVQDRICIAMRKGHNFNSACDLAGVSRTVAAGWIRKAKHDPDCPPEYLEFTFAVREAKANLFDDILDVIWAGDNKDSRRVPGITWMAERLFPKQLGKAAVAAAVNQVNVNLENKDLRTVIILPAEDRDPRPSEAPRLAESREIDAEVEDG